MTYFRLPLIFIAFLSGIILIIPTVFIMLPLWFFRTLVRTCAILKPRISAWDDIIQFDQGLGWRCKPNTRTYMETEGLYRVTIGSDGWRGNYVLNGSNTIVIGDSFVFGQGTDDKNHFARKTKNAKVKPIGAPGYGVTHYLLLLKNLERELKGKLVIWFVFTGNDYREAVRPTSYGYHFPFTYYDNQTKNYKIQTDGINSKKLPFNFEKGYKNSMPELADLYYKNYLSDYIFDAFEYLVSEARHHCEKHGAKFAVVTIPLWWTLDEKTAQKIKHHCSQVEKFYSNYPDERTGEICNRHAITFIPGTKRFIRTDYLAEDFHWSNKGNEKVATIIDELFNSLQRRYD